MPDDDKGTDHNDDKGSEGDGKGSEGDGKGSEGDGKGRDDEGNKTIDFSKSNHVAENKDADSAKDADKDTLLTGKDSDKANDADAKDSANKDADKSDADGNKDTPGEYAEFTVPEGQELDKGAMDTFKPIAKELGLTQEQAQKLVDVYSGSTADASKVMMEQIDALHQSWIQEVRDDKELGGVKFDETISTARTFINGYGDEKLTEVLNESGLGNHPAVVKLFYKLGRSMAEDNVNIGAIRNAEGEVSLAKRMFPSMA